MENKDKNDLEKRYLTWLYKTTKEALDRIERKFTQLEIDRFILGQLKKSGRDKELKKFIREFKAYIQKKEKEGLSLKYENKAFPAIAGSRHRREKPDYKFLVLKLKAIEKAITSKLGKAGLRKLKDIYMQEMLRRIVEERAIKA